MDKNSMHNQILAYIQEELIYDLDSAFNSETELLDSGLLDSMAAVQLVGFCEDEFNVEFLPEDLTLENFSTVSAVAELIQIRS